MKKTIALGIVFSFVILSFTSISGIQINNQIITDSGRGSILYVGGSGEGNYTTIQSAINDSSDGDTVFVYDDSSPYYENVVIDKSIDLIGEDRDATIINGSGSGDVIRIKTPWVNISEFTIMNSNHANVFAGIRILSDYTHITNCIVSDSYFGIYIESQSNVTVIGNNISNGFIGVFPYYSSNVIISNNTMMYNYYGIDFHHSNYNIASGNKILFNPRGIYSSSSNNNNILNNYIISNIKNIILVGANYHNISGNILSDSSEGSIRILSNSRNNTISGNIISNSHRGISLHDSSNNTIYHNNFINNPYPAYSYHSNNTWDNDYPSGGNYWDEYNGKDSDGDGIGDTPYNISDGDNPDRYPLMKSYGNWTPIAEFTWTPSLPEVNETILFNASKSIDYDGYITLYEWDWDNDGVFDENHTSPTATHSWLNLGHYPVTLKITDNSNLFGMITKTIRVGNQPPSAPIINGPSSGKPGVDYNYTFVSTDPEGDDVWYHISWDEHLVFRYGPYPSGEEITLSHNWSEKGTYLIMCRAIDIYNATSNTTTLEVTIPRNKAVTSNMLLRLLERFPLLQKLLQQFVFRLYN